MQLPLGDCAPYPGDSLQHTFEEKTSLKMVFQAPIQVNYSYNIKILLDAVGYMIRGQQHIVAH